MTEIGVQLGARIRALRTRKAMSQAELAEAAGSSEEWVRRLERGVKAPSLATLAAVSSALDVPVAALFAFNGPNEARFQVLVAEASNLSDEQLSWLEAAARLMSKMPA